MERPIAAQVTEEVRIATNENKPDGNRKQQAMVSQNS